VFPHDASLEFAYDRCSKAAVIERAVVREVGEIEDDRSRTTVCRDDGVLTLEVHARDLTALRAACNTWCTLVEVAERTAIAGERYTIDGASSSSEPAGEIQLDRDTSISDG